MKKTIFSVALCLLVALPAFSQETPETMIVFKLTGDEASAEHLDLINAEIFMILEGS